MKLKYTFWVLIVLSFTSYGQNVGIGTSSPNALLDVYATNAGVLIPRVALTGTGSASPLTSPTTSTLVYNTATVSNVTPGFYYWNGSAWVRFIDSGSLSGATTVSNTSSANTLSTTVNGVTGTGVNIINSNVLSMSGNNLTATINGIGSSAQSLSGLSLSGDVTGTLAGSTVGKLQGTPVTISSLANGNLLQYNSSGSNWVNVAPGSALFTAGTGLGWSGSTLNNTGVTSVASGSGLTGGPITTTGTIGIATGGVTNAMLTNSSLTVTAGTGMSGGGAVSLGGGVTLTNAGVISFSGGSTGLTPSTATAGAISLGGTLGVGYGGTGATTAAAALTNLGAAPSSGSGNYIQNGTTAQTANFNITGNGTAGGAFITPGYFFNTSGGIGQIVLNSAGTYYGNISNPAAQVWSLGYTASPTALGIQVLSWTPSGNVGIGTTSPGYALEVTSPSLSESRVYIHPAAGNATDYALLQFNNGGGTSYFGMDNSTGSGLGSGTAYALTTYAANGIPITFATGSSGSERMRILSSGNVAIGTTASNNKLTVLDPTQTDRVVAIKRGVQGSDPSMPTAFGTPYLDIGGLEYLTNSYQTIGFGYSDGTGNEIAPAEIGLVTTTTAGYTTGDLVFGIRSGTTNAAPGELMRIKSNGNVGIGTTSPNTVLEVQGDAGVRINNSARTGLIDIVPSASGGQIHTDYYSGGDDPLILGSYTHQANQLYLATSGNVGIGSTNPQTNLYVSGTTTPAISVASTNYPTTYLTQLGTQAGAQGILVLGNNGVNEIRFGNTGAGGMGNIYVNNTTNYSSAAIGTLAMTFAANGFVGVGSASPVYQMQVNGSLNAGYVVLGDKNNNVNNTIEFVNGTGSQTYCSGGWINYYGTGTLGLCIGGGNVSIGTTTASYKLTVNGQPAANGYTGFTNYSDSRLKKNIVNISSTLDKIMKLRPVQFNYNEEYLNLYNDTAALKRTNRGFIAQEIKEIFPEMVGSVKVKDKEYYDLNLSNLQVYLVKAMQEQEKKIEDLQAQNEQLKNDNNSLRSENAEIIKTMKAQLDLINERLNIKSEK
jgi:hypothetical protein